MSTDWEKELARIDKQLASLPDEKLIAAAESPAAAAPPAGAPAAQAGKARESRPVPASGTQRSRFGVLGRVGLAVALGVAILFWPYSTVCGWRLFGYLGALGVLGATGVLAAVATWRHRSPVGHVIALTVVLWTIVLASMQVLPRIGYAAGDPNAPATWLCP